MSRYWPLCVDNARGLALVAILLLLSFVSGCHTDSPTASQLALAAGKRLAALKGTEPSGWSAVELAALREQFEEPSALAVLLQWTLNHPRAVQPLLAALNDESFRQRFARIAKDQGKSFILIERLSDSQDQAVLSLLEAVRRQEQLDRRTRVLARELSAASPLQRVAMLEGVGEGVNWRGAAFLVAQSECQLGFATAGHNISDAAGRLRAPLIDFTVSLAGIAHPLVEVLPVRSSSPPEWDWALLIVDKVHCGKRYTESTFSPALDKQLPQQGLEVELYCFHQGAQDVEPALYREQCRIYPTNVEVLDYYVDKPAGQLGIHTCLSQRGSSGCPVLFQEDQTTYFLGTQIERDADTGAGVARLVSGEYAKALVEFRKRFL